MPTAGRLRVELEQLICEMEKLNPTIQEISSLRARLLCMSLELERRGSAAFYRKYFAEMSPLWLSLNDGSDTA